MKEHDIKKLPKWAQREFDLLRAEIRHLRKLNDRRNKSADPKTAWLDLRPYYDDHWWVDTESLGIFTREGRGRRGKIPIPDIRISRLVDRFGNEGIEINTTEAMLVRPYVSNVVHIFPEEEAWTSKRKRKLRRR